MAMKGPDWRALTEDDIARHVLKVAEGRTARRLPGAKPSKYRNQPVVVDGHRFDSKREAARYHELRLMEKAGKIQSLYPHPTWALRAYADVLEEHAEVVGIYEADFSYHDVATGELVVEDVKGMKTLPLARWKQKHLKAQYGVVVREIR